MQSKQVTSSRRCKVCEAALLPEWPDPLCPKCLVRYKDEKKDGDFNELRWRDRAPTVDEVADLFPQLEISQMVGQGGMGWVYKARQPGLDRLVCLKILSPKLSHDRTFAERFIREAKAMARLSHPNIISVYDFGISAGCFYFVMEFVDGLDLKQSVQAKAPTVTETIKIISHVCDALQYAHEEGVIHRDIKPSNILLDKRGRVKIADFGLAKLLGDRRHQFSLTQTNQAMGTPHYMAPEQTEKPSEVDHRADIYSLGVVFYELLTGELPIGRFPPPAQKLQLDPRLDDVVLRALEKDPQLRYQQADEVKQRLAIIQHTPLVPVEPEPAPVAPIPLPPPPPPRKTWGHWTAHVACLAIISVLLFTRHSSSTTDGNSESAQRPVVSQPEKSNPPVEAPHSVATVAPSPEKPTVAATPVPQIPAPSAPRRVFSAPLIFEDDFESGSIATWKTVLRFTGDGSSSPLEITTEKNHSANGNNSAAAKRDSDKMEYVLDQPITNAARATFWIYTPSQTRAYAELVANVQGNLKTVLSIGRYFPTLPASTWEGTAQPDSFHARVVSHGRSAWFNLDDHDSADFSEGWHKFQIEIHPEQQSVSFIVDDKPGRQVTDIADLSFDAIRIGSLGTGTEELPAWFDDIKVELLDGQK